MQITKPIAPSTAKASLIILKKEWREALRDKKAILSMLLPVVLLPLFLIVGLAFLVKTLSGNVPTLASPSELLVANLNAAPLVREHLVEHNFDPVNYDGDWMAAQEQATREPVLWLPEDFSARFARGESVELVLLVDYSNTRKMGEVNRLRGAINQLSSELAQARMISMGIGPQRLNPMALKEFNVASEKKMAGMILMSLPIMMLIIAFTASMGFAIDISSGEREKRTLESLLVIAPSAWSLVLGKYFTLLSVVVIVNLLFYAFLAVGFTFIDFTALGLSIHLSLQKWMSIYGLLLPIMVVAPAVQLLIGFGAKSFKEGQAALSLLIVVPLLPNFYLMATQFAKPAGYQFMPIIYQQLSVGEIISGEALALGAMGFQWLLALAVVGLCLWASVRKLGNPKTLYS